MALQSGGGGRRRRVDEQDGGRQGAVAETIPVDRISTLPNELRQRILTHLPLKDAIRTGALARGWRDLWRSRWEHRSSVEIHLRSRHARQRELDALAREPRPLRRLDRFSLIVDTSKLRRSQFQRFMEHAADCGVEDLHVEARRAGTDTEKKLKFHLPLSSPLLARLTLRDIGISFKGAQPLHALEVIRLHSVDITEKALRKILALCPSLITLDLRCCHSDCFSHFNLNKSLSNPPNLRSVTVADCEKYATLNLCRVLKSCCSLRSFRYSGSHRSFSLPEDVALADLYICLEDSFSGSQDTCCFNRSLPKDLSGLTVLTICSNVLPAVYSLWDDGENVSKLSSLQSLRELQLLMLKMEADNLANIYMFFKNCQCPNLERLFVQLPISNCVLKEASLDEVGEEPPEVGLDNLQMVKVTNFNRRRIDVQLVSFLLRKASSLQKLLLVSLNVAPPDNIPGVQREDLLLLQEALDNGKIILSHPNDAATQPYHS